MSFRPSIWVVIITATVIIIVITVIAVRCLARCFLRVVVMVLYGAAVVVRVFARSLVSCDHYILPHLEEPTSAAAVESHAVRERIFPMLRLLNESYQAIPMNHHVVVNLSITDKKLIPEFSIVTNMRRTSMIRSTSLLRSLSVHVVFL